MERRQKPHIMPALIVWFLMVLLIIAYVVIFYWSNRPDENRIIQGVYVEGIDISGKTAAEAAAAIDAYVIKKSDRAIRVDINGHVVETSLANLEFHAEENNIVDEAMQLGKQGNIFTNYAEIKRVEKEHVNYDMNFVYSEKKLKKFIKKECGAMEQKAVDATVKYEDGEIHYTKSKTGLAVDVKKTTDLVVSAINLEDEGDVEVTAVVKVTQPKLTTEMAKKCKDKIGYFSTQFNTGKEMRSKNLANAARLINGSVVMPGKTFSVYKTISPMTEENGYFAAPSYSNGEVVDSIGGGVCQVSTTLYNAVLRAELQVVERAPHSMIVSYVKPSMDAAIAGEYKDFKFKNNTKVPIVITGGVDGGTIFFNVFGEETRPEGRKIEFVSEVLKKIEPGEDIVKYDPTKPPSYEQVTQSAHIGYEAQLWKIITDENGKQTKVQVNSSSYKAVARHVVKGSGKEEPKATEKPKDKDEPDEEKPDGGGGGDADTEDEKPED